MCLMCSYVASPQTLSLSVQMELLYPHCIGAPESGASIVSAALRWWTEACANILTDVYVCVLRFQDQARSQSPSASWWPFSSGVRLARPVSNPQAPLYARVARDVFFRGYCSS